jgi:hypothetical protein
VNDARKDGPLDQRMMEEAAIVRIRWNWIENVGIE